jgi:phospholipid/cholesterol/gamma-HCH transport system substrate-binding protein
VISQRTKLQLAFFVAITLFGVSFVGARYAKLDRLVMDTSYEVTAHFQSSGGIFVGAEVTYRGVAVGRVSGMELNQGGVDVVLAIDNENDRIPRDLDVLVANKSAVGEQYVDLQPRADDGPFLTEGGEIAVENTSVPIDTTTLLIDINDLVNSVDQDNLRTSVSELGAAFGGAGEDLSRIIDTSNDFIEAADANFGVTAALIRDSRTVLRTQLASESSIRTFVHNLRLLSDTLVRSDNDLRALFREGAASAKVLRAFVADNSDAIGQLLDNVASTNRIVVARLDGFEHVLVLYPYAVEGGYTVIDRDAGDGLYDAHFGLVFTHEPPVCNQGYESTNWRSPKVLRETPFNTAVSCTAPQAETSARGAQHAPAYDRSAPVIGSYDRVSGRFVASSGPLRAPVVSASDRPASKVSGAQAWTWLFASGAASP